MTILNGTLTWGTGWIAQDRAVYRADGDALHVIGMAQKVHPIPGKHMALGFTGPAFWAQQIAIGVKRIPDFRNVLDAERILPGLLRELAARTPGIGGPTCPGAGVIVMGHVPTHGVLGILFSMEDQFAAVRLRPNAGHTIMPGELAKDGPDYPDFERLWLRAAAGEDMDRFHVALAHQQRHANERGLHRARIAIGGPLDLCRVDANGVTVTQIGNLDESAPPPAPSPVARTLQTMLISPGALV
ncbi:hypothetical protein D3093_11885 [Azospirillum argentinense]|uniref:Uncharacterized protein n=1 Tax=Azospirillum argentinense TaxID=2970906 RepID=A0A4D8PAR2_9PROT|nr:hypothetical protein [Azospirillum argentinense]QCN95903.1 hypothetical protein D3093_11885 [Azospirillum argentinense]